MEKKILLKRQQCPKTKGARFRMRTKQSSPTYVDLTPVQVKESLTRDQFRLYQLIWKRFGGKPYALSKIRYDFSSYYGRKTSICKFRFQTCVSGLFVEQQDDDKEEPNAGLLK